MTNHHSHVSSAERQANGEELSDSSLSMVTGGYHGNLPMIPLPPEFAELMPDGLIPLPKTQSAVPAAPVEAAPTAPEESAPVSASRWGC